MLDWQEVQVLSLVVQVVAQVRHLFQVMQEMQVLRLMEFDRQGKGENHIQCRVGKGCQS